MKLVFATHNQHKLRELQQIIKNDIQLISLDDLNYSTEIEETGNTLVENALLKARFIYERYSISTFADDTGLEIDALNGAPGVYSARFAGEDKSAVNNMNKVLDLMKGLTNRKARFKTVIALVLNGKEFLFEGVVEGNILETPVGTNGFGYDPIFQPAGHSISFAQMDSETKNRISHRGKAVEKLVSFLNQLNIYW